MNDEEKNQASLINTLIDMYSSNDIDLKRVKKELRKKFDISISLNKLTKMKEAQDKKREESNE